MAYAKDIHDLPLDFEDDAVISRPKLPIPSQTFPKGKPVLLRCRHQAGLDRPPDALPRFHVDPGEIGTLDVGVVLEVERHPIPRRPCA